MNWYKAWGKRTADFTTAAISGIILSPIVIVTAILVRLILGKPVIFRQQRPGKDEKIFTIYKFRTMKDAFDNNGNPLPDEQRLTRFGALLRSTSLDELPELWNILCGDMSFVGPRPLRAEYLPLYSKEQRRRHDVRPGLTGEAQVSGRNSLDWPTRFKHDAAYVEQLSPLHDLAIVWKTLLVVVRRSDIASETHATMEPFRGER